MGVFSRLFTDVAITAPAGHGEAQALTALGQCLARRELRGNVSPQRIHLELRGRLSHLPYQPVFVGHLDSSNGPTVLRGRIRTPMALRFFIWYSVAFCALWMLGSLIAMQLEPGLSWLPLGGVLMSAMGYGFFSLLNGFVARLARRLEDQIWSALAPSQGLRDAPSQG